MDYIDKQIEYEKSFYSKSKKNYEFYYKRKDAVLKTIPDVIAFQHFLKENLNKKIYFRLEKNAEIGSYQALYGEFEIEGYILNVTPKHISINVGKNLKLDDLHDLRMLKYRDIVGYLLLG